MGKLARLRRSKWFWALIALVAILGVVHLALPELLKGYVNRKLAELDGYTGHVDDVSLRLWRGAYRLDGVRVDKVDGDVPVPFFRARTLELSVAWDALLRGAVVAEIELHEPELNFVVAPDPADEQTEPAGNWTEVLEDLVPFRIERFSMDEGEIHYRDFHREPAIDMYLQDLRASVRNITNSEDLGESLFARFDARGSVMGSGSLKIEGRVNPYEEAATFELRGQLTDLDVTELNEFLKSYAKVDAEKGTFSVDFELAASDGAFRGYVKPFIRDLQIADWDEEEEGFFTKVWEGVVEVGTNLLEDQSRDTIATRVPLRGQVEDPEADVWATIGGLLRNAFIESLRRGLEGEIRLGSGDGQPQEG